jgi:hypothetical protein
VSKLEGAAGPPSPSQVPDIHGYASGEWMYMDIFMDNSMDNAEIWWVGIYVYDKWISV